MVPTALNSQEHYFQGPFGLQTKQSSNNQKPQTQYAQVPEQNMLVHVSVPDWISHFLPLPATPHSLPTVFGRPHPNVLSALQNTVEFPESPSADVASALVVGQDPGLLMTAVDLIAALCFASNADIFFAITSRDTPGGNSCSINANSNCVRFWSAAFLEVALVLDLEREPASWDSLSLEEQAPRLKPKKPNTTKIVILKLLDISPPTDVFVSDRTFRNLSLTKTWESIQLFEFIVFFQR